MLILFDFSHLSRHFVSLFISSAESITLSPGTQVESVLSSAYGMYLNWLEHFVISFMKIKNRRGPKIDPCGTPDWITLGFESTLFIDTYCSLFVRYERNQSKAIPRTPQVFNFDSRISWLTQLNALRKSRNKENTILPESICFYKYCKKCKMAYLNSFCVNAESASQVRFKLLSSRNTDLHQRMNNFSNEANPHLFTTRPSRSPLHHWANPHLFITRPSRSPLHQWANPHLFITRPWRSPLRHWDLIIRSSFIIIIDAYI